MNMRFKALILSVAALAAPCGIAFGISVNTFNQIVSFGDSLSDPGNISYLAQSLYGLNIPGPGYATRTVAGQTVGYFTNPQFGSGPSGLWIDQLAAKMSLPDPAPAFIPGTNGTNFSLGGANTAAPDTSVYPGVSIPSMQTEVNTYLTATGGHALPNALYTLWGGANDIGHSGISPTTAANNVMAEIQQLGAAGGKYFLWPDLPPLGDTPEGAAFAASLNAASAAFNAQWNADIVSLRAQGITVIPVDVSSLFFTLLANPGAYGFSNVTGECIQTPGCNPNTYLFFDDEHPTTQADSFLATAAYNDILAAPEPGTYALLLLGFIGVGGFGFRHRTARAKAKA